MRLPGTRVRFTDGTGTLKVTGGPRPPLPAGPGIPLEIAASHRARTRGLLGRSGVEGAVLLTPASSVHTLGMGFAIDVAHLDRELRVLAVTTMRPGRLGLPRIGARHVLEAEAGALTGWGVAKGVTVQVTSVPGAVVSGGCHTADMTEKEAVNAAVKGPASYFPSIEQKYGRPIAQWKELVRSSPLTKHMELVGWLKSEHGMGHGHANALVAHTLAEDRSA